MEKKSTTKNYAQDSLPQKIIGLLLKKPMSQSDLAEEIYGKRNVRSGISRWINLFLKDGWIKQRATNSKTILYTTNLEVLGNFNQEDYEFIKLVIQRFWNPLQFDSVKSLNDLLLQMIVVQKGYNNQPRLFGYNPSTDFKRYEKNKKLFWKNQKFRESFLDKIWEKEKQIKKLPKISIRRDYLFCSLLVPKNLFTKLEGEHRRIGNPLSTALDILENLNKRG